VGDLRFAKRYGLLAFHIQHPNSKISLSSSLLPPALALSPWIGGRTTSLQRTMSVESDCCRSICRALQSASVAADCGCRRPMVGSDLSRSLRDTGGFPRREAACLSTHMLIPVLAEGRFVLYKNFLPGGGGRFGIWDFKFGIGSSYVRIFSNSARRLLISSSLGISPRSRPPTNSFSKSSSFSRTAASPPALRRSMNSRPSR